MFSFSKDDIGGIVLIVSSSNVHPRSLREGIQMNRRDLIKSTAAATIGAAVGLTGWVPTAEASSTVGKWSRVFPWPDVAIHLNLLTNGKVFSFSDDDHGDYVTKGTRLANFSKAFAVTIPPRGTDPGLLTYSYVPNTTTNIFCCGHCLLPNGQLIAVGGHEGRDGDGSTDVNLLQLGNQYTWQLQGSDPMRGGRWYPSAITLASGEILAIGGQKFHDGGVINDLPEVYNPNATRGQRWRALTSARKSMPLYSPIYVVGSSAGPNPKGDVFMPGHTQATFFLNTSGLGAWTQSATRIYGRTEYGSSCLYNTNRVLMAGGGDPPRNTCEIINLAEANPVWRATGAMRYARRHLNLTILPDGKVLATGGTSAAGFNNGSAPVLPAEMWDPNTGVWTQMASAQIGRFYHSSALLWVDGRVLSAGGGRPKATNGGADNENAEFYEPPYLFKGGRPTINSAPTSVTYGQRFLLQTPAPTDISQDITQVTWLGLSAATHTFNSSQRFMRLNFTKVANGLEVVAPQNAYLSPRGHYMLFTINRNGVPSIARIIRIS
jgi:hypothetical protein